MKKNNQREFKNRKKGGGYFNTEKRGIQDITSGNRTTN
jgi:hypothetical protein